MLSQSEKIRNRSLVTHDFLHLLEEREIDSSILLNDTTFFHILHDHTLHFVKAENKSVYEIP